MREPAVQRSPLNGEEDGEQGGVQRALNIGIFKNQHRRFTASYHGVFFSPAFFMILRPVAVPPVNDAAQLARTS